MQSVSFARLLILAAVLGFLILPESVTAQVSHTLQPESSLWITGTSTRSDWTVTAGTIDGGVTLADASDGSSVSGVQVRIPTREIASKSSTIMDRLMHDALKATDHPEISYELVDAMQVAPDGGGFALQTSGRLTLAGVTRDVEMVVQGEDLGEGKYRYTGSTPLKMTDYDMSPPTAMFGALRTGNDVTVHFDIVSGPAQ